MKPVLVSGTDAGPTTLVRVDYSDGSYAWWTPFGSGFTGGAIVARGDVNRDGIDDIIVASGAGTTARVRIWDGKTLNLLATYTPFGSYAGGLTLAVGDVNKDGVADIAVGMAANGGQLAVINGATGQTMRQFAPYGPGYAGGLRLGVGDINRDGYADLVAAAGNGTRRVRVYDGVSIAPGGTQPKLLGGFAPFSPQFRGPANIAVADVTGDGYADVVVATGAGNSKFQLFSGATIRPGIEPTPAFTQFAWAGDNRGLRVSFAGDADGDGLPDLVVSAVGTSKTMRFLTTKLSAGGWAIADADTLDPIPGTTSGVFVG